MLVGKNRKEEGSGGGGFRRKWEEIYIPKIDNFKK